jgi:hypothetical protein
MFDRFRDVIVLAGDTGMRNGRELYRIPTKKISTGGIESFSCRTGKTREGKKNDADE